MEIEWHVTPGRLNRYELRIIRKDGERHYAAYELDDSLLRDARYVKYVKRELLYLVQNRLTRW